MFRLAMSAYWRIVRGRLRLLEQDRCHRLASPTGPPVRGHAVEKNALHINARRHPRLVGGAAHQQRLERHVDDQLGVRILFCHGVLQIDRQPLDAVLERRHPHSLHDADELPSVPPWPGR